MHIPITIDGITFPNIHVVDIRRSFSIPNGENAGKVMTMRQERDIEGTYYNYRCEVDACGANRQEYDQFWELISAPVESHIVELPNAQGFMTFEAYITSGSDNLLAMYDDYFEWGGLTFDFQAIEPQRRPAE